jgi:hypothetical protein
MIDEGRSPSGEGATLKMSLRLVRFQPGPHIPINYPEACSGCVALGSCRGDQGEVA